MNQPKMLLVTTPAIEGKRIVQVLGLVQGNTVRARNIGRDFLAGLRNVVGGEVGQYSRLLTESREQAISRMVQQKSRYTARQWSWLISLEKRGRNTRVS